MKSSIGRTDREQIRSRINNNIRYQQSSNEPLRNQVYCNCRQGQSCGDQEGSTGSLGPRQRAAAVHALGVGGSSGAGGGDQDWRSDHEDVARWVGVFMS